MPAPNHETLIQSVITEPDADEPRLAYAAWCEAQESPADRDRAEFIRAQLELAASAREPSSPRHRELVTLTEKLEGGHRAAWAGGLTLLVEEYGFDRGFIELVSLPAPRFLELQAELFARAPIRHLNLTGSAEVFERLLSLPALAQIRSLDLDASGLNDQHIGRLAQSPKVASLRWLSLAHNRLTAQAADSLAGSPYLKNLRYVNFLSNPEDPVESYSLDDGNIVGVWLPPAGCQLESRHGHIPWLHRAGKSVWDLVPNRFRIGN